MITINKIKEAHSKVKSGADFPKYIQEIKQLGVVGYINYVSDGHAVFTGENGSQALWESKYPPMPIISFVNKDKFMQGLKDHQMGKMDYPTFCKNCAECGVEKWNVNLLTMTCTYFDSQDNALLEELIPNS